MDAVSRFLSPLLYRPHLENGFSVAAGVTLAGTAAGATLGLAAGIAAATGALCVSIADQPDPLTEKPRILLAALTMAAISTLATLLAKGAVWSTVAMTAAVALWAGLISAYGKRAVGLGVTTILAFVLALSADIEGRAAADLYLLLFTGGGAFYLTYALVLAWIFDSRVRRLLMAEALRAFAAFLRTKARVFDPDKKDPATFAAMIEAHASAVERMQIARDAIYARTAKPWQQRQARALVALLDAFETILSSDADIEILQTSRHRHLMRRLRGLTLALAGDAERLALAPTEILALEPHRAEREAIAAEIMRIAPAAATDEERQAIAAFRSTADKMGQAADRIAVIGAPEHAAPRSDLALFRQSGPRGFGHLRAQFGFAMPAFRYAVRLSLAMCAGLGLTLAFPRLPIWGWGVLIMAAFAVWQAVCVPFSRLWNILRALVICAGAAFVLAQATFVAPTVSHGSWVLLTIALIMRANYSVTRQRRWDRVIGTLIGCVAAAALQAFVPVGYLLAVVALATGVSHAFGAVNYRVTAASASVSSLLLLHFLQPHAHHALTERMLDTLIGAGLSFVFSFLLPNWERNELPRTVAGLLKADREFACEAMTRRRSEQGYRLARKRLFDAVAALSGAVRRLADEPNTGKEMLARLNALLAANYLLLSDLTSMQVLFAMRGPELDTAPNVEALTAEMQARVVTILSEDATQKAPPRLTRTARDDLYQADGLSVLKRRLVHIEHAARRVALLAADAEMPHPSAK